jgi:hypothetical protein
MARDWLAQGMLLPPLLPEICARIPLSISKRKKSRSCSEETVHQKVTVPGPVTVVSIALLRPWLRNTGLMKASVPSWLRRSCITQVPLPLCRQVSAGLSTTSARNACSGWTAT